MSFTYSVRREADRTDVRQRGRTRVRLARGAGQRPDVDIVYAATPRGRQVEDVTTRRDAEKPRCPARSPGGPRI